MQQIFREMAREDFLASAASKQTNLHAFMVWAIFDTLEGH